MKAEYTAIDMATAAAEGFRDGVASVKQAASPAAAVVSESAEARFEHYLQNAIDNAPEPLRRLGEYLSHVLDEDEWPTAERLLNGEIVALDEIARLNPAPVEQSAMVVPEGYVLVPVIATQEMIAAAVQAVETGHALWSAMLAAAPKQIKEQGHE